jgi:hypothetical protein
MSMQPSTRRVPQDYASIQSAVNAAIAGDTVLVAPGVYQESVNLSGKSIVVKAEQVHGATIQAPAGQRSVVATTSEPAAAKVIGMRLAGPGNDVIGGGAAVTSAVTFDACLFENCRHDTGGGALVNGGTPTFLTCDFQRCHAIGAPTAYGGGGAIRVVGATTTIERCEFLECTSGQNAAVLMNEGGGSVVVREATIVGDPTDTQTQMYNASGSLTVEQSLFESGKGVAVFGWAPYTIRDTVAEALSSHEGDLSLDGLTTLGPPAARFLARHKGSLSFFGLKSLGTDTANVLAEHQGYIALLDEASEALESATKRQTRK